MINAANEADVKLNIIPAVVSEMDNWIAKGHGGDDWSIIAKDNL
jgi:3-hydroxyisobutyrate dehydrogenase